MAVVPGTSPTPPGVPRHARTSIPRVVPFRQARSPSGGEELTYPIHQSCGTKESDRQRGK